MQTRRLIRSIRWLLLAVVMLFIPSVSFGQVVGISITVAPPALPVYVQPFVPATIISGRPATGLTAKTMKIITGCPAHGCLRLRPATCGHPDTGDGTTEHTDGMTVTGDRTSVSMAG